MGLTTIVIYRKKSNHKMIRGLKVTLAKVPVNVDIKKRVGLDTRKNHAGGVMEANIVLTGREILDLAWDGWIVKTNGLLERYVGDKWLPTDSAKGLKFKCIKQPLIISDNSFINGVLIISLISEKSRPFVIKRKLMKRK